ncbi:aldo/keto reductase [Comamonas sp. JC664]|uniref:aldo/keto reductase n=1 Tax=Comamonas sp. JC664 TaxID=2801917 RepID=UPI00174D0875|nr:aldo/keto reductase [Comamonas sp. JC664]MBL0697465.1 aldo/keto reductase [Comamonas sp. JC664]GHG67866.1 aldo/keto reductase [Comamonas sp. KCTC 72670]
MEKRGFGNTRVAVPVLGQGTWQMEADDRASALRALRAGLDVGMTHVDTAELYGHGQVEEAIVAEAISGRRDEVFLVSKVMPSNATYAGTLAACERSLKRLRTDWLDCYLLHWPGSHPLEETVRAFEKLVADGKIRAWGVSNFDVEDLEEALALAGPGRIACNQVLYHLEERAIEHAVLPWCEANGVAVVGYSPFGNGSFPRPDSRGGKVLGAIARAHGVTPYQVALRFLVRRPSLFAIPKASREAHVRDNAAAASLVLTAEELALLDRAFPLDAEPSSLPVI